jgi:hypothetical protein
MTEDLTGTWEGIYSSATVPAYTAYGGDFDYPGRDLEIHRTDEGPTKDYGVRLVIASQGAYKQFGTPRQFGAGPFPLVSIVAGEMAFLEAGTSAPVSGFVDNSGLVNLSIYWSDPRVDQVFVGRLTHHGLTRDIRGNWMYRVSPGSAGPFSSPDIYSTYRFARLSVRNNGFGPDDRAYTVDYGHVF